MVSQEPHLSSDPLYTISTSMTLTISVLKDPNVKIDISSLTLHWQTFQHLEKKVVFTEESSQTGVVTAAP